MYKGSRVSHRKKARRPASVAPVARKRATSIPNSAIPAGSVPISTPPSNKTMEEDQIPTFDEFLKDVPYEEEQDEECAPVSLFFSTRQSPASSFSSPASAGSPETVAPGGQARPISAAKGETPLYSNLPTISLKTNPAPTNILSDFGKTFGKGVRQATQQAKVPLNNLGIQIKDAATQVVTSIPMTPAAPPPVKKSQLETLLERAKPRKIYQDLTVKGEPRVLVVYNDAMVVGKDVSFPGEENLAVEVESAVLIGTPIDSQNENSQKKLQKIFGSFGAGGHKDFDFKSLPRFIEDIPGTNSIRFNEISPPIEFPSEESKASFLDSYSAMCYKVNRQRHEAIQGTIWSAVIVEDLEALASFPTDFVNQTDYMGRTALHYAAAIGDGGQSVSILLGMGADSNVLDDELSTPLHLAAKSGNVLAVHSLLRAGADPNSRDLTERTAFFWAASMSCDSEDITAAEPFIQVMEALVDVGKCDVEVRDTEDRTALHLCVDESGKGARVETLGALLRAPLNLDPSSVRGDLARTALHYLCLDKVEDPDAIRIATILLESGARVNFCDKRGDTALHLLIRGEAKQSYPFMLPERLELAALLVRFGARLDIPNASGHTPAEAAKVQRINLDDALAKWAAKKEPSQVAQMAADPKMIWNLPRAADKQGGAADPTVSGIRSVTARLNRAINDNVSMPWQAESEASQCYTCRKPFSLLQRKYHCRLCGWIHCSQCTSKTFTMCPPVSQPPPVVAVKDRVCDSCFNGMCTSVERTSMALMRMSQDREAAKRRTEQEDREALGLKAPSAMDKASMTNEETAMSSTMKARDALGERGERISRINDRTAKMRDDAQNFAEMATKLRQQQEKSTLWPF